MTLEKDPRKRLKHDPVKDMYVNIGTNKCCCFVRMSVALIKLLKKYPLMHSGVEESLECAEMGYYCAGILVFAQMLNLMKVKTPEARNRVAHEVLEQPPTEKDFHDMLAQFKAAAEEAFRREQLKNSDNEGYREKLYCEWLNLKKWPSSDENS